MMLDVEALRQVKKIVTHANGPENPCADGVASAIILHDVLPDAEIVFATYDDRSFPAEPHMLFCDFTPPRERAREFVEAGVFVLDHHEKQRDIVELFGHRGVYADEPGVSGAVLAFEHVWALLARCAVHGIGDEIRGWTKIPESTRMAVVRFAKLVGVYDTWQKQDPSWKFACERAEALRFWPIEDLLLPDPFDRDAFELDQKLSIGRMLFEKKMAKAKSLAAEAYRFQGWVRERPVRIAVIPTTDTNDAAELIDADVVVGFRYASKDGALRLRWSFRSRNDVDVGEIAKALGGGGHKAAAGATVEVGSRATGPRGYDPYTEVREVFGIGRSYGVLSGIEDDE